MALAVGAAVLVNVALAGSLVWSELLPPATRNAAWGAVLVVWVGSAVVARAARQRDAARQHARPADDAYLEALDHYLKGNWFEAECLLRELLRRSPRDLEAGLTLATLLRHTGRLEESLEELDRLERFDGWERWAMEIGRERALAGAAREGEVGGRGDVVAEAPAEDGGEKPAAV